MFYKYASLVERFNIIVNLYEIYYYIKKQLHSSCFNPSQTGIEPATFRLGGEPSILLRYMDVYKIFSVGRLFQQALRRDPLYPFN